MKCNSKMGNQKMAKFERTLRALMATKAVWAWLKRPKGKAL
ncbi:Uncharacterised protein [uncultured archaeon]|nr:Uncharacterised protein [uncultured archaeon]